MESHGLSSARLSQSVRHVIEQHATRRRQSRWRHIDPRRKNRLHCVLKAVITSSGPSETTSTGSFWSDRAKADDILADATNDPPSSTRPHCVLKFLRSWLPIELQWPRSCFDQCAGCAASEEGRVR